MLLWLLQDLVNGYSCDCATGWSGTTCSTNLDDCTPDPCHNGGTCLVSPVNNILKANQSRLGEPASLQYSVCHTIYTVYIQKMQFPLPIKSGIFHHQHCIKEKSCLRKSHFSPVNNIKAIQAAMQSVIVCHTIINSKNAISATNKIRYFPWSTLHGGKIHASGGWYSYPAVHQHR